jgi:endonuclease YncB( thermonuclease family)
MVLAPAYRYVGRFIRAIDGDTIVVDIDLGFRMYLTTPLRLLGVNAPEKNTPAGKNAMAWTTTWCTNIPGLALESAKPGDYGDKYGRYLATVYDTNGRCLNKDIIVAGHAIPFMT